MMYIGPWQATPRWLLWLGKPAFRRWREIYIDDGWEYAWWPDEEFVQ